MKTSIAISIVFLVFSLTIAPYTSLTVQLTGFLLFFLSEAWIISRLIEVDENRIEELPEYNGNPQDVNDNGE